MPTLFRIVLRAVLCPIGLFAAVNRGRVFTRYLRDIYAPRERAWPGDLRQKTIQRNRQPTVIYALSTRAVLCLAVVMDGMPREPRMKNPGRGQVEPGHAAEHCGNAAAARNVTSQGQK